jgi:tRNA (mo5U34)-methyltransferase
MDFSAEQLQDRVRELGPFHHLVQLPHGVTTQPPTMEGHTDDPVRRKLEQQRADTFKEHGWPQLLKVFGGSLAGLRVLDIACNCGGFAVQAIQHGADYVLGIDIVDNYLEQGAFIRDALGYDNLEFRNIGVDDLSPESVGEFDVVLCFGILYHLENPIRSMKAIASVTSRAMLLDTNILRPSYRDWFNRDKLDWRMRVTPPPKEATYQTTNQWIQESVCEFTPTKAAVIRLMRFLRFETVDYLPPTEKDLDPRYYKEARGTFLAVR